MQLTVRLAQYPDSLDGNPPLIEDMLELNRKGQNKCVTAMIKMIADLRENGTKTRYLKQLGGSLYELKTRTPVGGARVYFFVAKGMAILCRAECKKENAASKILLLDTVNFMKEFSKGDDDDKNKSDKN
jgi:phage-related protein